MNLLIRFLDWLRNKRSPVATFLLWLASYIPGG